MQQTTGTAPSKLEFSDLDAEVIGDFLSHLERDRGLSARSRNVRLTAIRSLYAYAALRHPEHAALIGRVLAIPAKRGERTLVNFLVPAEVDALLASPDRSSRVGRRDHALLVLALQTALRVAELSALCPGDLHLGTGAFVHCVGKGRKERTTPLTKTTVAVMHSYLAERGGEGRDPLFPGPAGRPLGRDAIRRLVERHASTAARACPSLTGKSRRRTRSGTPAPCASSRAAPTSRRSLSGWAAQRGAVLVSPAQRAEMRGVVSGSGG